MGVQVRGVAPDLGFLFARYCLLGSSPPQRLDYVSPRKRSASLPAQDRVESRSIMEPATNNDCAHAGEVRDGGQWVCVDQNEVGYHPAANAANRVGDACPLG